MRLALFITTIFIFVLLLSSNCFCLNQDTLVSTFSIVAVDLETGDVGVAVQSKFPNVRPVVPWAEAGVGAVATQSFANVSYGPRGLELMRNGTSAEQALRILIGSDSLLNSRQVGIVDAKGNSASWTGTECFDWAGGRTSNSSGEKELLLLGEISQRREIYLLEKRQ